MNMEKKMTVPSLTMPTMKYLKTTAHAGNIKRHMRTMHPDEDDSKPEEHKPVLVKLDGDNEHGKEDDCAIESSSCRH